MKQAGSYGEFLCSVYRRGVAVYCASSIQLLAQSCLVRGHPVSKTFDGMGWPDNLANSPQINQWLLSNDAAPAPPNSPALTRLNQLWPLPLRRYRAAPCAPRP